MIQEKLETLDRRGQLADRDLPVQLESQVYQERLVPRVLEEKRDHVEIPVFLEKMGVPEKVGK